jgi:hypothetical protein
MPDLLTHIMVAEGCRKIGWKGRLTPWFLVGTVLPDLLTRPFTVLFPGFYWWVMPLHTPIGLLLVCTLLSRFYPRQQRSQAFSNLIGGAAVHLLLDVGQKHIGSGYQLLFPFSWSSYEIGLFWPETSLYLLPLWLAVGIFVVVRVLVHQRGKKHMALPITADKRS